jgi:hypothetical protein
MSQGKPFTPEEREDIINSIKPHLQMGFSRNKACAFIGLKPQTLSNWVVDSEALGMKLTSWENTNTALALANVYQALQNENELLGQGKEVRADNSWKLLNVKEDGYKPKQDITTDDKALPTPILTVTKDVHTNDSNEEDSSTG